MADACLLLVDAAEGPMPQTKFVLRQALKLQKKIIVCINKVDKPASRVDWVLDTTFDLFGCLGADDEACDFPVVYASGFQGVASTEGPDELEKDLTPLLDTILQETPPPKVDSTAPLQMLVSNLDYDDYVGRICIGRLISGELKVGQEVGIMYGEDGELRKGTVTKLWQFKNNDKDPTDIVKAGDICCFSGISEVMIGDTVVDTQTPLPLPPIQVEEPTVAMEFTINKSPFAGKLKESTKVTAPQLKARLEKECLTNLAIRMEPGSTTESFKVKGRGTLQLGILMENMRREGFEFMVSAPEVLLREDPETGKKLEPYEEVVIDVPNEYQGVIMEAGSGLILVFEMLWKEILYEVEGTDSVTSRHQILSSLHFEEMQKKMGVMNSMESGAVENSTVLTFEIPTRCTIGMPGRFAQRTSGSAVMSSQFSHWGESELWDLLRQEKGSICTTATGKATFYSILNFQQRGKFFVEHAEEVYAGQVIGLHNKEIDLDVNITKEKAVSNVRAASGNSEVNLSKLCSFPKIFFVCLNTICDHF
ncbi:50S ribosomal subunit assembly factor BipA (GTP-binding protein BipA) [Durusdinium trenchii]|uniref:50S ribosomal subunit assembly factor BipA (GTP-binding protein BipA) n=1 Tax=Durusdinium trenchii TaxID=1381693 RepID=A0ABP0ST35_9DINO